MNFTELVAEVQAHGFTTANATRQGRWINEAYHTIARKTRIRDFLASTTTATVSGTATYTLPTDMAHIVSVTELNNDLPLALMAPEWFDVQPISSGMPTTYMLDSTGITYYPTPNSTAYSIRIRYYSDPVDLTGTAIPVIPSGYHDALVAYAVSRSYRSEDDPQQAMAFMADFDRRVAELAVDRRGEIFDGPLQVPGTWAGRRIGNEFR